MNDQIRTPPHNDDAERSLLGAILLDNGILDSVLTKVSPEDFYRERHRHVYRAMRDVYEADDEASIDVVTLGDHLAAQEKLEAVGGASF
ncbi:MAG: DnaB-like helicase N-terminal domain-containing protein, partial [Bradymonadaceae bacterium]